MKKFACGVEDAEAFGSELVALVHLSRTVERSAQVGEPTLLPCSFRTRSWLEFCRPGGGPQVRCNAAILSLKLLPVRLFVTGTKRRRRTDSRIPSVGGRRT